MTGYASSGFPEETNMTQPLRSVLYRAGPNGWKKHNATADTANLKPGLLCYRSGGSSIFNAMTECPAKFGGDMQSGSIFIVIEQASTKYLNGNFVLGTTYADLDPIEVVELQKGDFVWLIGSSLTATQDEMLVTAASGLVTNVTDPDGLVVAVHAHAFRVAKAVTSGTYVLCEYMGIIGYDDS
jgi:hypothetical protein